MINMPHIRNLRKTKRYTLRYVAQKLGLLTSSAYWKKENGRIRFSTKELEELSVLYQVPIESLFISNER